eukprot:gnl/TRDRNA2_/TRDRNA2_204853_c0_seq1.p1 gnl/TRDRNA2_/TRDRNA2_204853_c0~~gnl/TRDRNA2_/TRDRNA2_204853_c0_seq1.p1  ORF type:complete len:274 (-),score=44.82 gnl/TRDRNA2_/TRDRNA2_204853_c0_seq1:221-1042(-)
MRTAVQCFIAWMMVLVRKRVTFFTEDFSEPISLFIDESLWDCVLFEPEVLWAFDSMHFEFLLHDFLNNAKLWDKHGQIKGGFIKMFSSWRDLEFLLQVRSPTTKMIVSRVAVHLFVIMIAIFNEDIVSQMMLPLTAGLFVSILSLAAELSDPWGKDFHDLPLSQVMLYCSTPAWSEEDNGQVSSAIAWLNKGLTEGIWTYGEPGSATAIPRRKVIAPNKGEMIDFNDMRTLVQVSGTESWSKFIQLQKKDMDNSAARGRRMVSYLRWQNSKHL